MQYTFNLTATDSKIHSKTIELKDDMTINELKLLLVGPIVNSLGYDKIKFFQTGRQFGEDNVVGDFDESERILIFPMIPSLRIILVKSFSEDDDEDEDEEIDESKTASTVKSSVSSKSMVEEEAPKMEFKSLEDIVKSNNETIDLFENPKMRQLLDIYSTNRDVFLRFIDYISQGQFNEFEEDVAVQYPEGMFERIRETFPIFSAFTDEELRVKLNNVGGNLDLLICQDM